MKQQIFNISVSLILIGLGIIVFLDHYKKENTSSTNKTDTAQFNTIQPAFLQSKNPEKDLIAALNYYNVKFPEIVYAQAILETGHFKSRICKEYNNLFGLYNSKTKDYYKFNHWSESIIAYLKYIQYRYNPPTDYYEFLKHIKYAKDPKYIHKLKRLVNQYDKERITDITYHSN